jgi:hypothetical protein
VAIERGSDGADTSAAGRAAPIVEHHEQRRLGAVHRLGFGTLACPRCDAPVAPARALLPVEPLGCPYCGHGAAVRDFLSLGTPTRPARVEVRVVFGRP